MYDEWDPDWPGYDWVPAGIDPIDPDSLRLCAEGSDDWRPWFMLAFQLFAKCRTRETAGPVERTLRLNPVNGHTWEMMAQVRLRQARRRDALQCLLTATALRPDLVSAWHMRAHLHFEFEEFEDALHCCREVLRAKPSAQAYWDVARALVALERESEAMVALEECVRLSANHTPAHRALVVLGMRTGEPDVVRTHLRALYALDEDMARAVDDEDDCGWPEPILERRW